MRFSFLWLYCERTGNSTVKEPRAFLKSIFCLNVSSTWLLKWTVNRSPLIFWKLAASVSLPSWMLPWKLSWEWESRTK